MIKRLLCLIIIAVLMLPCVSCSNKETNKNTMTGYEWINSQQSTVEELKTIINSTQEVYTLYISGNIGAEDFLNELKVLQQTLFYHQSVYEDKKGNIIIQPDVDEVSQKGIDSLEKLFADINDLYTASVDHSGVPYSVFEVSYIYINYKESIINDYTSLRGCYETFKYYDENGELISQNAEE